MESDTLRPETCDDIESIYRVIEVAFARSSIRIIRNKKLSLDCAMIRR